MDYEECRSNLESLVEYYNSVKGQRNEATTRLHFIDQLLFKVLNWIGDDCEAEERYEGQYTDYTLSLKQRALIVEAKREGDYFELPAGQSFKRKHKIHSLMRDYAGLKKAIPQAINYCQQRGVSFGVVTNGHQIVAFLGARTDGVAPLDGDALVFDSLEQALHEFQVLWNGLSKDGVRAGGLRQILVGSSTQPPPNKLSARLKNYPGQMQRNVFQQDLNLLSEMVLEDLPNDKNSIQEFLNDCYCSGGALPQYALISKKILEARYFSLFDEENPGPTIIPSIDRDGLSPDLIAEALSRRPVLLLGDVGVGKSTFIKHLIYIDAPGVFKNAISLTIDLGSKATLTDDLHIYILREIEQQLLDDYEIDVMEDSFVRGVYHGDIQRFEKGIYGRLKNIDPIAFFQKELEFLAEKQEQLDRHLQECLNHLVRGRKKQVVLFIDNADQRDGDVQDQAFLIAHELAENWPVTVFVALRPETFYRSKLTGSLSGYHPKAFTISPPRIDLVIEKRLDFGIRITEGKVPIKTLDAFGYGGFHSLNKLLKSFKHSVHNDSNLIESIDSIAGGNVRTALDLVRDFFGSAHVDTEKIVRIYDEDGDYFVPLHEFLRAVIFDEAKYYSPQSSLVTNLFDIRTRKSSEHFLLPALLCLVKSEVLSSQTRGFSEVYNVVERLQEYGYTSEQIERSIEQGVVRGLLLEPTHSYGQNGGVENIAALRITTIGAYHIERLIRMFTYLDAVVVDTPILDDEARGKIRDVGSIKGRLERVLVFKEYLDQQWNDCEYLSEVFDWAEVSIALEKEVGEIGGRLNRRKF